MPDLTISPALLPAISPRLPPATPWIAERLRQAAVLLRAQGANPFRANAYHHAAEALEKQPRDVRDIAANGGHVALDAIPGVGPSLAGAIAEMLATGRWSFLERLKGGSGAEALFASIPGIGESLAHRVHERLNIDSLEALEAAAQDGRLGTVPGFGPRRVAMVRHAVAGLLDRLRPATRVASGEPDVETLLDIDREYREKAASGALPRIAPKRFNPIGAPWLPVLHTERGPWHATALFSNTARAHELGRTNDWVVIFFHRDGGADGRRTVVTEIQGPSRGQRVVRGRELDSLAAPVTQPARPADPLAPAA